MLITKRAPYSEFRDASQSIVDAAVWGLPVLAVVDAARQLTDGWGIGVGWLGYVIVTIIAFYQRRTRKPDLTLLVATGALWIAGMSLLRARALLDVETDSAASMVALVVLALVLVSMSRVDPVSMALIAAVSLAGWTIAVGAAEDHLVNTVAFRTAVVVASFGGASWIVIHVRRDLRASRHRARQSENLYEALAQCARDLLEGGDEQDLEHAFEAVLDATSATSVFVEINVDDPVLGLCSSILWERGEDVSPGEHWALVPWSVQPMAHSFLSQGKPFVFTLDDLEGVERELYGALDDYSEADYPIFVDGQWVGSVGFGYIQRPLLAEYRALGAVAEMIAAYWKRNTEHERLEQSVASRASLVAAVSHELRTPLTGIVGLASELADRTDIPEDERRKMLHMVAEQAFDMASIVDDLLVASGEDGQIAIALDAVKLCEVTERVLSSLGHDSIPLAGPSVTVVADPARVRQVVRNLVTNAHKYGGGQVRVETGTHDGLGFVEVADNGQGVKSVDVERIFDPYERAHSLEGYPGSIGLGLSVSRRLARVMGGDLAYERVAGETVFRLTLPLYVGPSQLRSDYVTDSVGG